MPIDAQIPLMGQPAQIGSPLNMLARAQGVQNLMQQNQLNAMQMQDMHAQRAMQLQAAQARQQALASLPPPPDDAPPELKQAHQAVRLGLMPFEKYIELVTKPDEFFSAAPGSAVTSKRTGKVVTNVPEKSPDPPQLAREYEYAVSHGFKGTPLDWVRSKAQAVHVTMPASDQGRIPPGYRMTPDGNLEAIKGGPADTKQQGVLTADTQALAGTVSSLDRLAAAANEVLNAPGLPGVYGLRGAIPNIPGSDAANAAALLNTLKSQVGFGVLQDMRNNSKTGGALGAVSDKENAMLQANLAALEKSQSVEQAQESLRKIIKYTEEAKDRLRSAYNMKHGDAGSAAPQAPGIPADVSDLLKKYGGK